jgi:hypothetical protein
MLDLAKGSSDDDAGATARFIGTFFERVLTDESYTRFEALLVDKERVVSIETLTDIIGWLVEEYTGRPEEQPELSSAGQ